MINKLYSISKVGIKDTYLKIGETGYKIFNRKVYLNYLNGQQIAKNRFEINLLGWFSR